ncbi:MAG: AAA family ATPase [Betaproteobacteria bacterium]|nr:AAA family ATPase [Betaproteobacteria bacterium]
MLIHEITLRNLLSFGPDTPTLKLGKLNVLIGPNGAGKSNFLEAFDLLRCAPGEIANPIREGGGVRDWLWKGGKTSETPEAMIEILINKEIFPTNQHYKESFDLRYRLKFSAIGQVFEIVDEQLENEKPVGNNAQPYFYYKYQGGNPVLTIKEGTKARTLQREQIDTERSILAQRRDPDHYPEITHLAEVLPQLRLYREWGFGRYTAPRLPQRADGRNDFLELDASNLGLMLNRLRRDPEVKRKLLEALKLLYHGIDDYDIVIEGGTVQVFFQEGMRSIPATRLSDGTLRYLCLLAILLHPKPPPLVCIEEPELGLHPDILPGLAKLLIEASERCQLIVTTHSDVLVDAMTDMPEAVVVCERTDAGTTMNRLNADDLKPWLEKYRLGELWSRGDIGGNRW